MTSASIKADLVVNPIFNQAIAGIEVLIPAAKAFLLLERISYIYYLMQFKKNQVKIQALLNFGNEINTIISIYIVKQGLKV